MSRLAQVETVVLHLVVRLVLVFAELDVRDRVLRMENLRFFARLQ